MGRLFLLILIIATVIVLWQAFGPKQLRFGASRERERNQRSIAPKGPDDDPDFLWNIKKERFKEQRRQDEQRRKDNENKRRDDPEDPHDPNNPDAQAD